MDLYSLCKTLFQCFCIAFALLAPVVWKLYTSSPVWRFRIKMFFFTAYFWLYSLLLILFSLPFPNPDNARKIGGWLMRDVMKFDKVFGIKMEQRGLENFDVDGSFIAVCNHQSSMDMIPMFTTFPKKCTGMAKRELLLAGPVGLAIYMCGGVFVDRRPGKARAAMAKLANDIKEDKLRLWMYPEGTRNHGDGFLPFKKGAFHLAIQAGVPVIPVVVSSLKGFYDKKTNKFDSGKMIITVLPAVSSKPYNADTVQEFADTVRGDMLKTFEATSAEITGNNKK